VHMSIDSSLCLFPRVSIRQYSGDYMYIIIFRNVLLILHAHMFLIESLSLAFIYVKRQTASKGKNKLYKAIESK
jgi:hypothetical protein